MKKNLGTLLVIVSLLVPAFSFAQVSAAPAVNIQCADLTQNAAYGTRDNASNSNVLMLQNFLAANGYLKVVPTGFFGNATLAAVKAFQSANKISATGYVGALTRAAIVKVGCSGSTASSGGTVSGCTANTAFSPLTGEPCTGNTPSSAAMPATTPASTTTNTSTAPTTPVASTGSVSVTENTAYSDQSPIPNTHGQEIGSFVVTNTTAESLDLKGLNMGFIVASGGSLSNLSNLSVQVNSVAIGAPLVIVPLQGTIALDTAIAPAGTATVNLYADIGAITYGTINATLAVNATGVSSGTAYSSGPAVSGQTLTFTATAVATPGTLTMTPNAAYADQSVAPNTSRFKVGSYLLQNTTSESILVNELQAGITVGGAAMLDGPTGVNSFYPVISGAAEASVLTPAATPMSFPIDATIPAGTTLTIDLYANLATMPDSSTIQTTLTVTGVGQSSQLPYTATVSGQTITIDTTCLVTPTPVTTATATLSATGSSQIAFNLAAPTATTVTQLSLSVPSGSIAVSATINIPGVIPLTTTAFSSGVAHFLGLFMVVPDTTSGLTVPVSIAYPAGTTAASPVSLTYLQYNCGGPTQISDPAAGS